MSLQDITKKILSDAQKEAKKIMNENMKEINKITIQKDKEITAAVQALKEKGKEKATKLKEQAEFQARSIEKNAILEAKQELINQVYQAVKRKLAQLKDAEFINLMVGLLKNAPRLAEAEIITSVDKKDILARAVKKAGYSYKIAKKNLAAGQKGFILSSKTVEINNTIDNLVNSQRDELEVAVAKILFG